MADTNTGTGGSSRLRLCVAAGVGLLGALVIWLVAPLKSYLMGGTEIADDYLPIGALFVLLVLTFIINPLLGLGSRRWRLTSAQLIVIMGVVLVGSILPGQGLLKVLPYALAGVCVNASEEQKTAVVYQEANLPPSLFPDKIGFGAKVFASDRLIRSLFPNEKVPWGHWIAPLVAWAPLLLAYGLMMIGLARIVTPQWRDKERLAYPLLEIYRPLVQEPEVGRWIGPIFRGRSFWVATGLAFLLHGLTGVSACWPGSVPAIPLSWDLSSCFTEEPWRNAPQYLSASSIYFTYVAIAYFVTTRISFSLWFVMVGYGLYQMIHISYFPPYEWNTTNDHRAGVALVLFAVILWLGRARWRDVGRSLLRFNGTGMERRNGRDGWMVLAGLLGMAVWYLWAGATPGWALVFVGTGFMASLLISRVVAETGIPFLRIFDWSPLAVMSLAAVPYVGAATAFLATIAGTLYHAGTRIHVSVLATHVFALEEEETGRRIPYFATLLMVMLAVGIVVVGGVLLYGGYHFSANLAGYGQPFMGAAKGFDGIPGIVTKWQEQGTLSDNSYNQFGHIAAAAGVTAVLLWLCTRIPAWPLHPVGFLMLASYYGQAIWTSVFLGWLSKTLIVRYGGSQVYRAAKPFFLGLIFGELLATIFWCVLPAIHALNGNPYVNIPIRP